MSTHWKSFWQSYRNTDACTEEDLFVQVGKTLARQPIPHEMFVSMVERIIKRLALARVDHLLDMCCGNGLVSFELAQVVGRVTGVDFAEHLIKAALEFKALPNIEYLVGDVAQPLSVDANGLHGCVGSIPNKFLMNDALAYFDPEKLGEIIDNVCAMRAGRPFRFLMTGIPNSSLMWNFYDTPERKRKYAESLTAGDGSNDGLGRWWDPAEIEQLCHVRRLDVRIEDQPGAISNYRMDALIWRD